MLALKKRASHFCPHIYLRKKKCQWLFLAFDDAQQHVEKIQKEDIFDTLQKVPKTQEILLV